VSGSSKPHRNLLAWQKTADLLILPLPLLTADSLLLTELLLTD
jgi:hypothetical protein